MAATVTTLRLVERGRFAECVLYRFFDMADQPLYYGITQHRRVRMAQHRKAPWWPQVAKVQEDPYACRADAELEERRLIRRDRPPHNVMHKDHVARIAMFERHGDGEDVIPISVTMGEDLRAMAKEEGITEAELVLAIFEECLRRRCAASEGLGLLEGAPRQT